MKTNVPFRRLLIVREEKNGRTSDSVIISGGLAVITDNRVDSAGETGRKRGFAVLDRKENSGQASKKNKEVVGTDVVVLEGDLVTRGVVFAGSQSWKGRKTKVWIG